MKKYNSGFVDTNLESELKRLDISNILLMGVNASVCVQATGMDAIDKGFDICASRELMADPPDCGNDECVAWYKQNGVYRDDYTELLELIAGANESESV